MPITQAIEIHGRFKYIIEGTMDSDMQLDRLLMLYRRLKYAKGALEDFMNGKPMSGWNRQATIYASTKHDEDHPQTAQRRLVKVVDDAEAEFWSYIEELSVDGLKHPKPIPEGHRPNSLIGSLVTGVDYVPLQSYAEAKAHPDGVVIMEGDWGGEIFLTCPMKLVQCSEETLKLLLKEINKIEWLGNDENEEDGDGTGLYYEAKKPGDGVSGGMGGGLVQDGLWLHPNLADGAGFPELVKEILAGREQPSVLAKFRKETKKEEGGGNR